MDVEFGKYTLGSLAATELDLELTNTCDSRGFDTSPCEQLDASVTPLLTPIGIVLAKLHLQRTCARLTLHE